MIFGGGNPATATTEILDTSVPLHPSLGVRSLDVAATNRDERDHPPEWEGPGDWRINQ